MLVFVHRLTSWGMHAVQMAPEPPDAQTDAAFCAHVQQLIQEVRVRRGTNDSSCHPLT